VDCPLESFCDLLGISANKANEYLCEAKLLELHKVHKTIGINKRGWDTLKSEFGLEIEREHITLRTRSFKRTKCGPKRITEGKSIPESTLES
jgi:hypothetical protein